MIAVQVNGTLVARTDVGGGRYVTLDVTDWVIVGSNGRLLSDGLGRTWGSGPGEGNAQGSGGKWLLV